MTVAQPAVDLDIHARHEERCDRVDTLQIVASFECLFKTGEVGVDHLAVAGEREDERDVHRNPGCDRLGNCRQAFDGCRDFDHGIGAIDLCPQCFRLGDSALGVIGQ